ncbi:MAG: pirin family protein [Bdellovibrionales bacterium]
MSIVDKFITPKTKDLGDGFVVRRALPTLKHKSVGPFVFWDHMGPVELQGSNVLKVRSHPHIGLATITWLFSGMIMHRDSLGNKQLIKPGEVNWMTTGSGITHSERMSSEAEPILLEGIQLWLALPKEHEDVDASFYHCKENDVPQLSISNAKMRLIAGEIEGAKSPVPVYSDLFYLNGSIESNKTFSYQLPEDTEAATYIINGGVKVEGENKTRFDMIIFKKGALIEFESISDCEFMFFGGKPFPEKRYMWWNFVSTSQQKIEDAKVRWKTNKFPKTFDEEEFTPLPEN